MPPYSPPGWALLSACFVCYWILFFGNHRNTTALSRHPEPKAPVLNVHMINTAELDKHFEQRGQDNLDYWHGYAKKQRSATTTPGPTARRERGRLKSASERKECSSNMVAKVRNGWPEAGGSGDAKAYWKLWSKNAKRKPKSISKRLLKCFRTVRNKVFHRNGHNMFEKPFKKTKRVAGSNVLRYWQK